MEIRCVRKYLLLLAFVAFAASVASPVWAKRGDDDDEHGSSIQPAPLPLIGAGAVGMGAVSAAGAAAAFIRRRRGGE